MNRKKVRISIIGGGYVGLISGLCFAELGHSVSLIDIDEVKVNDINLSRTAIYEPGIENLLIKHGGINVIASQNPDALTTSNFIFICVGTPQGIDGTADLSGIFSASRSIGEAIKESEMEQVVVVKSTVPPGTTEHVVAPIVKEISGRNDPNLTFAMNPEFLSEGKAIEDFLSPDRIIIGCSNEKTGRYVASLYRDIAAPVLITNISTAEMIKYVSNAFLATKISFSNEIGNICKRLGVDVYEVMKGVGMDRRISPHFLNAGVGFGGSCLPKDVMALIRCAESIGEDPVILKSVLHVNETQACRMITLLEKRLGNIKGRKIAVLGLAFKDQTDDVRDSRTIPVIRKLVEEGAEVAAFDPVANSRMAGIFPDVHYCTSAEEALTAADACLVMTEWPEFSSLDKEFDRMKKRVIIEGRRILSCSDREGICW